MEQFLQYQTKKKLVTALTKIANSEKKRANFQQFKRNFAWIAVEFDAHINHFYTKTLPEKVAKIRLPEIIKSEITYYYWLKQLPATQLTQQWPKVSDELNCYRSKMARYFDNYQQQMLQQNPQIVLNYFFAHWESLLTERIINFQLHETLALRQKFIAQWNSNIILMPKLKNLIGFAWNFFGQFWTGDWKSLTQVNLNLIIELGQLLIENPAVKALAEQLGRWLGESELTKLQIEEKVVIEYRPQVVPDFFEEVIGYGMGKSLEHILPLEIANLALESLNPIFLKRLVEGKLAIKEFEAVDLIAEEVEKVVETVIKVPERAGPIIIVIDSSKSMMGSSEQIAKSLTLAITKIALTAERPCYLINFSGVFETYDLSSFHASIPNLLHFLQHSFLGQTNINPVFDHVLTMLDTRPYQAADVLILSDFLCSNLTKTQITNLHAKQQEHHRFLAINIAPLPITNNWQNYFDHYLFYDPRDGFANRKTYQFLSKIK